MNMARIAMGLAFDHPVGGITVNRFCASGVSAIQMAADRIRAGEADVLIAGGAESMSMVPMGGNKPSFNPEVFARDENVGIAYGMGLTAEKWPSSGRCRAKTRTLLRWNRTCVPSRPSRPASSRRNHAL